MTFTIQSHPEAAQALMDLWADNRANPDLPDQAKDHLTALMTTAPDMERKVMMPELVFAFADEFSEECRSRAAALMDFAIQWDFWGMRTNGRGEAISAALRGIEGGEVVEPLPRFKPASAPVMPTMPPPPPPAPGGDEPA